MADKGTSLGEIVKTIPQVDFDIIGRLTPGIVVIGSILFAVTGPDSFWIGVKSFSVWPIPATVFIAFTILVVLVSCTLAVLLRGAYASLMMWIFSEKRKKYKYWDNKDFCWKYENVRYNNPAAGSRITKLKAQVHMAETLLAGFSISFLLDIYFWPGKSIFYYVSLLLAFFSWCAKRYFVHHMKISLDNNFQILMSQKCKFLGQLVLLFDFDGTLVEINKLKAYRAVVTKYGSIANPDALAKDLYKADNELCMRGEYDRREVFKKYASEFRDTNIEELCQVFWEELARTQNIKPCCLETLEILKNEGHILACVTDSDGFGGNKLERIQAAGLDCYFDRIFIGGEEGRPRKDCAEYMKWVVRELEIGFTRWVMVGDKVKIDLVPAEMMGMTTVLVKNDEYPGTWSLEIKNLPELFPIIRRLKPSI
jgi:FMN phosphatase YigB (HAD superfamily)